MAEDSVWFGSSVEAVAVEWVSAAAVASVVSLRAHALIEIQMLRMKTLRRLTLTMIVIPLKFFACCEG